MPTLYLIDGNSYIYRAFYAISRLSTSTGFPTNAIYGFTNMILKVLKEKKPDYFAVVFDSPEPTERHKTYEAYKAQRPAMPEELKPQVPFIKEIIDAFRIHTIEIPGYEADDILATLAKKAERKGFDVYIVTADKDLYQVISPKIRLYDSMRDKVIAEKDIIERFGVKPSSIPDVLALMGDTSDNIPGVPGIGEKTAVSLLKEFGSLDKLIRNYSKIKKEKLRIAISENINNIELSRALATVDSDISLEISIDDLKPKEPEWARLLELFRKFEFRSLLKLIPEQRVSVTAHTEYIPIINENLLRRFIASINDEVAIDIKGSSKSPMMAGLVGISLSTEPEKAYYIPITHSYPGISGQLSKETVLKYLKKSLENPEIKKIGHNIKYSMMILKKEGVNLKGIAFDTMLASYLLNPNKVNHSLEDAALEHLAFKKLSLDDVTDKGKKKLEEIPVEDATRYAGEDVMVTLQLKRLLEPEIEREGLARLFYDVEIPLIEVLTDMEMAGIKIDLSLMEALSRELDRELTSIEKRIYFMAGEEFNINSPKQLQEVLFKKLGLRTIKKIKTGFSTDIDVLQELALEHELPGEILEYRALSKLKNTYVDALRKIVNPKTGRLHTSFNQTVTATGRLSSSDPNLQNIPIRGEWGRRIREAFIAEERNLLLSADYSQIELRILAHLSQDRGLIEVFKNDGDIHARTASELFGVSMDNVTGEMRRRAKTVNFGVVYGISPYGLSQELGITPEEAKNYIDTYFERHKGVKNYVETVIKEATEKGYVSTLLNRKRSIPELKSQNKNTKQLGERLAVNTPIQGSAADIIKISMINIWRRFKKERLRTKMLLQVHDELLFEVPVEEQDKARTVIKEEMEKAVELLVPLKVDIGIGKNWAEAH